MRHPAFLHTRSGSGAGSIHGTKRRLHGRRLTAAVVVLLALLVGPGSEQSSVQALGTLKFSGLAVARQTHSGYTPAQIHTAYGIDPLLARGLDGTGQTIALVELDSFNSSDIAAFDAANNLPDPNVAVSYVGGKQFRLTQQGETTMDLEWAHAVAPGAKIHVYYIRGQQANVSGWQSVGAAVNSAVADGARSISLSFGTCNPTNGYEATSTAFAAAANRGVSVFVSSGDTGDLAGPVRACGRRPAVGYPASDPSVVSVGGTSLLLNPDNTPFQQFAWSLSGGGKAKPIFRPSWQVTPNLRPGKYRYVPDVSFLANPSTGVDIYLDGNWQTAGGTSLGAPAWAAIWALMESDASAHGKSLAAAPSLLYKIGNSTAYSQAFTDITSGSNGTYGAGKGWDAVTGWGTPLVSGLDSALRSVS